jgi:hypothetical protein
MKCFYIRARKRKRTKDEEEEERRDDVEVGKVNQDKLGKASKGERHSDIPLAHVDKFSVFMSTTTPLP